MHVLLFYVGEATSYVYVVVVVVVEYATFCSIVKGACLNNVFHFFIVPVSLHFCSMTSITSLSVIIQLFLFVAGGKLLCLLSK